MAEELQLRTCKLWQTKASLEIEGEEVYREKEEAWRGYFESKSIGGKEEFKTVMVSLWQSCGIFLLAEFIAVQGESLLFPAGVVKVGFFLLEMQGSLFLLGSAIYFEW